MSDHPRNCDCERCTEECECGDYRRDHIDGAGACRMNGLGHFVPSYRCLAFKQTRPTAKPVMMCTCGEVLETPRDYAAHCKNFPEHFTKSRPTPTPPISGEIDG